MLKGKIITIGQLKGRITSIGQLHGNIGVGSTVKEVVVVVEKWHNPTAISNMVMNSSITEAAIVTE